MRLGTNSPPLLSVRYICHAVQTVQNNLMTRCKVDQAFIFVDGTPHGPYCHTEHHRHRRSMKDFLESLKSNDLRADANSYEETPDQSNRERSFGIIPSLPEFDLDLSILVAAPSSNKRPTRRPYVSQSVRTIQSEQRPNPSEQPKIGEKSLKNELSPSPAPQRFQPTRFPTRFHSPAKIEPPIQHAARPVDLSPPTPDFVEGIFHAKEVDVVYLTTKSGHRYRGRFKFEWELVEEADESVDQFGISIAPDAKCELNDFNTVSKSPFIWHLNMEANAEAKASHAIDLYTRIIEGLINFETNIQSYKEQCPVKRKPFPCELIRYRFDVKVQDIVGMLHALLRHSLRECTEGFGQHWFEAMIVLENVIGGDIPIVNIPYTPGTIFKF